MKDNQKGFLGSFLSKGLKTNQLEVNTDEKTLRPIARLKEPRDLFALPKDKDNDCSQQAPRWPIECQVIEERIKHIPSVPLNPEPFYHPTGHELKPRPVGEENGIVVFNYNPISAVNYKKCKKPKPYKNYDEFDSSDTDDERGSSCDSTNEMNAPTQETERKLKRTITRLLTTIEQRSSSNSNDDDDDDDDDDEDDDEDDEDDEKNAENERLRGGGWPTADSDDEMNDKSQNSQKQSKRKKSQKKNEFAELEEDAEREREESVEIEDIWANKSPEYRAATPTYIKSQFGKIVKPQVNKLCDVMSKNELTTTTTTNTKTKTTCETNNIATKSTKAVDPENDCNQSFSRSAVGGAKFLTNCHPYNPEEYDGLEFESRFESGNLAKAVRITATYYELYLRPDLYTSRAKQWYYFRVKNTKKNMIYRFSIVNLIKTDSLYNEGMRPLMYSTINAKNSKQGWQRCGDNICYYRNDDDSQPSEDDDNNCTYTLTFNVEFPHDNDTVFLAHSFPYTYSDLQDYLMDIQKHPVKSKFCKLRLLCRTLAGNNVYFLTVTANTSSEEVNKRKKCIVISARVHPSETPASWMMKGLMDFITGDTSGAKRLRHKFIFKLIPMLNPDGVIVGNSRHSLIGKDLNRQYRTVIRETYPSIWYTKALIKRLIDECGVSMYCDMHSHSRRHNIFIYGCENSRNPEKKLHEQVFPLMLHKNAADKFCFEDCRFKIQRNKEGTGRIVVWMLGITNSYTLEASIGGSLLGSRKGTLFTIADYEHMGRVFCETLLDYCDENPTKVKKQTKFLRIIKKIRKREKRERKELKLKKLAQQGCIIEEKFKVKQRAGKSVS